MARDRSEWLGVPRWDLKAFRDFHEAYAREVGETARRSRTGWDVRPAVKADSLRRSAEAALVLGDDDAVHLVAAAGRAYADAGLPFGAFLVAAAGDVPVHGTSEAVAFVAEGGVERGWWHGREPGEEDVERRPNFPDSPFAADALAHPVQRVYLALAEVVGANAPDIHAVEAVNALVGERQHVPAGPFGVPVGSYAAAATEFAAVRTREATRTEAVAALVTQSDRRHQASVDAVRHESPTSRVAFMGAALIDLDAFACAAAMLRLGADLGAAVETFAGAVARDHLAAGPLLA